MFASVLKYMYRAVKSTKICSVPRIFETKCKLFMCAKGKHRTKRELRQDNYRNVYKEWLKFCQ